MTRQTQGAFDIATGALIKAWGFYRRQGRVPTPAERAAAMSRPEPGSSPSTATDGRCSYLRQGLEINLGGIGKGYALDRAAELLADGLGRRLGPAARRHRRSVRAVGTPPGQPRGWPVAIKHPWDPNRRLGTRLPESTSPSGTSAATFQHFEYNGRKLGHLLDPRTGWPAEGVEQVSVVAPTAAEADALSTAFFVLGVEPTARFCQTRPDIGVVMLPAGQDRPLTFNLTARDLLSPPAGLTGRERRHDPRLPLDRRLPHRAPRLHRLALRLRRGTQGQVRVPGQGGRQREAVQLARRTSASPKGRSAGSSSSRLGDPDQEVIDKLTPRPVEGDASKAVPTGPLPGRPGTRVGRLLQPVRRPVQAGRRAEGEGPDRRSIRQRPTT